MPHVTPYDYQCIYGKTIDTQEFFETARVAEDVVNSISGGKLSACELDEKQTEFAKKAVCAQINAIQLSGGVDSALLTGVTLGKFSVSGNSQSIHVPGSVYTYLAYAGLLYCGVGR